MQTSQALDRILTDGLSRMFTQGLASVEGVPEGVQATDRAIAYLNETKLNLVTTIQNTLKEEATGWIADGIERGESITQISERLKETGITDHMAERVARTETARAYQFGELEGASSTGTFAGRGWLLAGGPCPLCSAIVARLAGVVTPYDQPFIKAGTTIATSDGAVTFATDVWVPSEAHPQCRCASVDILKPD
jgi:hypothetical protein